MRLFLDANVLFSAARNPAGRTAALVDLGRTTLCDLVTSPHAVEEARRNLARKQPEAVESLEDILSYTEICREASARLVSWAESQKLPPEDAPILAAAVEARADLLVTGDATHFGHLHGKKVRGLEVVSPASALAWLLSGEEP